MPSSDRAIKRLATILLKHREDYLTTRNEILTKTADAMYDGFIKPLAKYGRPGKGVSRFGIDEETWRRVQAEIKRGFGCWRVGGCLGFVSLTPYMRVRPQIAVYRGSLI